MGRQEPVGSFVDLHVTEIQAANRPRGRGTLLHYAMRRFSYRRAVSLHRGLRPHRIDPTLA